MQVLITNKNRPNVRMVAGRVSSINIGFTMASNKPNTMAKMMAE
jgi:hypothetical protein